MHRNGKRALVVAGICLLTLSCADLFAPSVPLEKLREAPLVIEIQGRQYTLETYLWRDFMPGMNPGGSNLLAVIDITAVDKLPFPADIDSSRLWVLKGDEVWETGFAEEQRPPDQAHLYQLRKVARDGPKWDTGIQVEVVVKVISPGGASYLLRATKQTIGATY
jgi:hypothetical protein